MAVFVGPTHPAVDLFAIGSLGEALNLLGSIAEVELRRLHFRLELGSVGRAVLRHRVRYVRET